MQDGVGWCGMGQGGTDGSGWGGVCPSWGTENSPNAQVSALPCHAGHTLPLAALLPHTPH